MSVVSGRMGVSSGTAEPRVEYFISTLRLLCSLLLLLFLKIIVSRSSIRLSQQQISEKKEAYNLVALQMLGSVFRNQFRRTHSAEGPTGSTLALLLDGRDGAFIAPINGRW